MSSAPIRDASAAGDTAVARATIELADPLSVIASGMQQLAGETALSANGRATVHQLGVAAERALGLQRELAVLGGVYRARFSAVDLEAIVATAVASGSSARPKVSGNAGGSLVVSADDRLLSLLCRRLLTVEGCSEVRIYAAKPNPPPSVVAGEANEAWLEFHFVKMAPTPASAEPLALVEALGRAVARAHRGEFRMEAKEEGTTLAWGFSLARAEAIVPPTTTGEGRTVLLIDDDDAFRMATTLALQGGGFRVLQARSGADALETWKWHGQRIRIVVTDVALEGDLSGLEVARQIRAQRGNVPFLISTGLSDLDLDREGLGAPLEHLQKPFPPDELIGAMLRLLAVPAVGSA